MSWTVGRRGCLKLNDTIIEFGNWKIEYETSSWSGSFDINGTKLKEVVGALASCEDKQPEAEFDEGKFKFSGKIILEMRWKKEISDSICTIKFSGIDELNGKKITNQSSSRVS